MDILEELKQDAHQARMLALWNRYRAPFFATIAAIVLGSGIYAWKDHIKKQKADEVSTLYAQSLMLEEKGEISQSIEVLSQLSATPLSGFRLLSLLFLGDILSLKDTTLAQQKFSTIYQDRSNSSAFRYLALLKSVLLELTYDKEIHAPINRLKEFRHTLSASSSWARFSDEMEALQYYNQKSFAAAHQLYVKIAQDQGASTSQKERALRMIMNIESHPDYTQPTSSSFSSPT